MNRILIVDDEPELLRTLQITLAGHGYDAVTAADGRQALSTAACGHPDLVLLDLGLPDIDGIDVVRELRTVTPAPIVILSGRLTTAAKVDALDAGADDYVTKPFTVDELLARLRAAARRPSLTGWPVPVRFGRWLIDMAQRQITSADDADRQPRLTPTEWHLLDALLARPGVLVTGRHLLEEVWGREHTEDTQYLRQYIKHLRHKLEDDPARPRHILNEPGLGYRFVS